jgi:TonB-dependent Receptor Plug Domain
MVTFVITGSFAQSGSSISLVDAPLVRDADAAAGAAPVVSAPRVPVVRTWVQVDASADPTPAEHPSPHPFHAIAEDILPSAGTYGDFSRYVQVFPGVVSNGDYSDDIIVRGGNPIENLYLVDGFEVPNINQISIMGTTGGISTMIDTAAIEGLDLYTGGYDASFDERLSSVLDVRTRSAADQERHGEEEVGYIGAGGLLLAPLGRSGSILGSAHQSFLNLMDKNVGLGGTPIYNNMLWTGHIAAGNADQFEFLSLSGFDTIHMQPEGAGGASGYDDIEPNQIKMQYTGWRTTNGIRWRHVYSPASFGALTLSDSEDQENIAQQDTLFEVVKVSGSAAEQLPAVPVYSQVSRDGRTAARYDLNVDPGRKWSLITGTAAYLNHVNYQIAQPEGEQSPLSLDPAATDATSFYPNFLSGETGSYAELTYRPFSRWSVSGGGRVQTFALGGHWTATPRLNTAVLLSRHTGLHAAFGEYAQMPPTADVTSWPQNHELLPIRVRHIVAGADLFTGPYLRIGLEAYQKNYRDYPVSSQFPSLTLANMVDDLGQEILWIPLVSRGTGLARGVEFSAAGHIGTRFTALMNLAYARSEYAGTDGILRPGNYDYPFIGNTSGTYRTAKHYEVSWRYTRTSGKPYTPYLLEQSMEQNRPIYDLSQINALRGPVYSRLDFEADRTFLVGHRRFTAYVGVDNATNHKNFLGYYWMPRIDAYAGCEGNPQNCVTEVDSFPIYPDGGVRYKF